jgi:hypothetical protein
LRFLAGDAQLIARSDLRWRRDLLLDHQLLDRHHLLVVEEEPEPAPVIQIVPAPVRVRSSSCSKRLRAF